MCLFRLQGVWHHPQGYHRSWAIHESNCAVTDGEPCSTNRFVVDEHVRAYVHAAVLLLCNHHCYVHRNAVEYIHACVLLLFKCTPNNDDLHSVAVSFSTEFIVVVMLFVRVMLLVDGSDSTAVARVRHSQYRWSHRWLCFGRQWLERNQLGKARLNQ